MVERRMTTKFNCPNYGKHCAHALCDHHSFPRCLLIVNIMPPQASRAGTKLYSMDIDSQPGSPMPPVINIDKNSYFIPGRVLPSFSSSQMCMEGFCVAGGHHLHKVMQWQFSHSLSLASSPLANPSPPPDTPVPFQFSNNPFSLPL
jgi:hypothetical protein